LIEWSSEGHLSRLEPLRTAQAYVHRLIDKTPGESELLMITVIQVGLKLDTLIATLDRRFDDPSLKVQEQLARLLTLQADELSQSLDQFDIISGRELIILGSDDLPDLCDTAGVHDGLAGAGRRRDDGAQPGVGTT